MSVLYVLQTSAGSGPNGNATGRTAQNGMCINYC